MRPNAFIPRARSGAQACGFYDDVVVATDDGGKICRRRCTIAATLAAS